MSRSRLALAGACAGLLMLTPAAAADHGNVRPGDWDAKKFVSEISLQRMTEHQTELQAIASLNDNTRTVLSPGYAESLDYVVQTLKASGYHPKVTQFNFPVWKEAQPPVLNLVSTDPDKVYRPGTAADDDQPTADFITMGFSPTVELTNAPVFPVGGIVDPPTGGSASGCAAADYAGVEGKVALVQRGTCAFVDKWALAEEAGATGVIIYNEGNTPTRQNPIFVDDAIEPEIAAVITSYAVGNELLQLYKQGRDPRVDFKVYGFLEDRFLPQVLAETREGDPNNVVVVGAHLDSVPEGPGINDDGSGVAMLLTQAQELAEGRYHLRQKVRFMFFGAEEDGLIGSRYYASTLSQREVDKIDVMLDYDMLASPNYVRFIYDGDGSTFGSDVSGPEGSGKVEQVHDDWFRSVGLRSDRVPFDGRSDYVGFTERGIPAGGVFAGAEVEKTVEQERIYGGAAGSAYDPCYHEICDNLMTVLTGVPPLDAGGLAAYIPNATDADRRAAQRKMRGGARRGYREMAGAASYAVWYFARSRDPFGTKPRPKPRHRNHRWHGHNHRLWR